MLQNRILSNILPDHEGTPWNSGMYHLDRATNVVQFLCLTLHPSFSFTPFPSCFSLYCRRMQTPNISYLCFLGTKFFGLNFPFPISFMDQNMFSCLCLVLEQSVLQIINLALDYSTSKQDLPPYKSSWKLSFMECSFEDTSQEQECNLQRYSSPLTGVSNFFYRTQNTFYFTFSVLKKSMYSQLQIILPPKLDASETVLSTHFSILGF